MSGFCAAFHRRAPGPVGRNYSLLSTPLDRDRRSLWEEGSPYFDGPMPHQSPAASVPRCPSFASSSPSPCHCCQRSPQSFGSLVFACVQSTHLATIPGLWRAHGPGQCSLSSRKGAPASVLAWTRRAWQLPIACSGIHSGILIGFGSNSPMVPKSHLPTEFLLLPGQSAQSPSSPACTRKLVSKELIWLLACSASRAIWQKAGPNSGSVFRSCSLRSERQVVVRGRGGPSPCQTCQQIVVIVVVARAAAAAAAAGTAATAAVTAATGPICQVPKCQVEEQKEVEKGGESLSASLQMDSSGHSPIHSGQDRTSSPLPPVGQQHLCPFHFPSSIAHLCLVRLPFQPKTGHCTNKISSSSNPLLPIIPSTLYLLPSFPFSPRPINRSMRPHSVFHFLLFLFLFTNSLRAQCSGCCDGCCGCCDCGCGCGGTIQIQLPQNNGSQQSSQGSPAGMNISQGAGQQPSAGSSTMNDQIPKMVAELIAKDIMGKMNENEANSKDEEEKSNDEGGDGAGAKKSRPKGKSSRGGGRRERRQAVWPLGPGHSHLQQHQQQSQLSEQQLEQKFQQVVFLQQRPLTPLQAEPPPLQPPEFPVPSQPDIDDPPKPTKMGPLRVIHVKPTSVGSFTLVEGQFEVEDQDLKHPFEEPFQ